MCQEVISPLFILDNVNLSNSAGPHPHLVHEETEAQ